MNNTNELEVFFDYACPYCLRGHKHLGELSERYPKIKIAWRPCEAHPRPERYGPHSDLCIRGMFYAAEHGADIRAYHDRMFKAALTDRADIENISVLAGYVRDIVDAKDFKSALEKGGYEDRLNEANTYAYERSGVWAVPSYRLNGSALDAVEGVGVSREDLLKFVQERIL